MDQKAINVIKNLTLDMIQNSGTEGSYGISFSAAPILYTLFTKHLRVNPSIPDWINRDRFVLSASHASALLYATMFLTGYPLMIDDLKNYKQLGSKTPAYPSINTLGVDLSTGPLGQGFATAVGMALAEKKLEALYNDKSKSKIGKLIDYNVYVLVSDGDLMKGISYEAASFAGTMGLDNLIVLYDSNEVSSDGEIKRTFSESVLSRFSSMGWNTIFVKNGNSSSEINKAIEKAKKTKAPTIIQVKTIIGEGLLNQGKLTTHSQLLDKTDMDQFKQKAGVGTIPFTILKEPASYMRDTVVGRSIKIYQEWENLVNQYKQILTPQQLIEINNLNQNLVNIDLNRTEIPIDYNNKESMRESNHRIMNIIGNSVYNFIGGSSDLANSTRVYIDGSEEIGYNKYSGKNIPFGVRDNFMGACLNGLAISGFRSFGSSLLVYSDSMRESIRQTALMNLPVTYIFTHDSITNSFDGPTHQPVEQLSDLRSIPNLYVFRPADIKEIIGTWNTILNNKFPAVISLPKTEVKAEQGTKQESVVKGAYVVGEESSKVDAVIIATGAEVQLAKSMQVKLLQDKNIDVRIVSMPCMELYNIQSDDYKESVIPTGKPIFVLEFGSSFGWEKFVPSSDYLLTVDSFGASGSKEDVLTYMNINIDKLISRIENLL
ncbi:MAG: transketolase [Bacilli bacterium]|nr:transketolase [Bacilli bacterium]